MTARIRYRESVLRKSRASVTGAWQVKFFGKTYAVALPSIIFISRIASSLSARYC